MKLISNFKDYYDSAVGHGVDEKLVYNREWKLYASYGNWEEVDEVIRVGKNRYKDITDESPHSHKEQSWLTEARRTDSPSHVIVGFCGKEYSFMRYPKPRDHKLHPLLDAPREYINDYDFDFDAYNKRHWYQKEISKDGDERADIFLAFKAPSYLRFRHYIIVNPVLKDVDFGRRFDAYSAFQEIAMFVGGVLPEREMIEISNDDKRDKHGFDDLSFKKGSPGDKKKRRKENKRRKNGDMCK